MHDHLEMLLPPLPSQALEAAVEQVLAPFREGETGEEASLVSFWDWYQIGGRYSGAKQRAALDSLRLQSFCGGRSP